MGQSTSLQDLEHDEYIEKHLQRHVGKDYNSWWTWTSRSSLLDLERRLFTSATKVPFTQQVFGGLGTVTIGVEDTAKPALVLVHGYAICNAMWALVVDKLSPMFRLYLVELHGHGRSDRVPFPEDASALQAESLMAAYIERWRKEIGLEEKFILAGHSLGAMVCWRYAAEHPERLKHLVLVSPVGVPPAPDNLDRRFATAPWLWRFIMSRWKSGTSPMDVIRSFGPLSRPLISSLIKKRMSFLPEHSAARTMDIDLLTDLLHQSWCLPRSGEAAMNAMLIPGAYAKEPILTRVRDGMEQPVVPPTSLKMSLIYGAPNQDWMQTEYGFLLAETLAARGQSYVRCQTVERAGHLVPWDNPDGFCEALVNEII